MAQDPKDAQAADAAKAAESDGKAAPAAEAGLSFRALIQSAKDKKNDMVKKMEKLDADTTDIPTLMEMALAKLYDHEKRLNDLADASEGKLNFLSQYARAKGVIYIHSIKLGVGLIGGAYGRGVLMARSDAGWSLPLAVTKPEVKLGPQMATVEEDQILLLSSEKGVKGFVTGKTPHLSVGVDAFLAFGDKGAAVQASDKNVASNDQKGIGLGSTVDFGTFRDFKEANEAFYGKDYDKNRILNVSPEMDDSEMVKALGKDKLKTTKKFIEILEGFQQSAQEEMAQNNQPKDKK